jgi:N-acetylglutamate synthase-like GNAT family acetyltransferase
MNSSISIMSLTDCQEHLPILANLWYEEISRHWVADASVEKAKERLISHLNKDKMPMATVALFEGQPVGMACLRETDGIRPGIAPWLGSLVVDPNFRGAKIGATLIDAIKSQARFYSYETLYLLAFDPTIPIWYAKLGWQPIGYDRLLGHRVAVMSITL